MQHGMQGCAMPHHAELRQTQVCLNCKPCAGAPVWPPCASNPAPCPGPPRAALTEAEAGQHNGWVGAAGHVLALAGAAAAASKGGGGRQRKCAISSTTISSSWGLCDRRCFPDPMQAAAAVHGFIRTVLQGGAPQPVGQGVAAASGAAQTTPPNHLRSSQAGNGTRMASLPRARLQAGGGVADLVHILLHLPGPERGRRRRVRGVPSRRQL